MYGEKGECNLSECKWRSTMKFTVIGALAPWNVQARKISITSRACLHSCQSGSHPRGSLFESHGHCSLTSRLTVMYDLSNLLCDRLSRFGGSKELGPVSTYHFVVDVPDPARKESCLADPDGDLRLRLLEFRCSLDDLVPNAPVFARRVPDVSCERRSGLMRFSGDSLRGC